MRASFSPQPTAPTRAGLEQCACHSGAFSGDPCLRRAGLAFLAGTVASAPALHEREDGVGVRVLAEVCNICDGAHCPCTSAAAQAVDMLRSASMVRGPAHGEMRP